MVFALAGRAAMSAGAGQPPWAKSGRPPPLPPNAAEISFIIADALNLQSCIPFEQEKLGETCACCGKPAKHMIYWGVAY